VQYFSNSLIRYVPSEGAAGLILKTKSAAIRDGDNILAVVRSTNVKHDGRSQGLVAPNVKAQIAMQISLLEKANLTPAEIEYVTILLPQIRNYLFILFSFVEAHGTGMH
jgi:acyl transferase domain-containing protein